MAEKPADGKFSLSYFLNGEGSKDWLRSYGDFIRIAITAIVIFCIAYTIYTVFFPKKPQGNINKPEGHQTITVTPFAKTGDIKQEFKSENTQKVEEKKRAWWMPILYSSASAGIRSKYGDSKTFDSYETELRVDVIGVRWDWN